MLCTIYTRLCQVLEAVYDMVLPVTAVTAADTLLQSDRLFSRMDRDQDGLVTREEFLAYCYTTDNVLQSFVVLP